MIFESHSVWCFLSGMSTGLILVSNGDIYIRSIVGVVNLVMLAWHCYNEGKEQI